MTIPCEPCYSSGASFLLGIFMATALILGGLYITYLIKTKNIRRLKKIGTRTKGYINSDGLIIAWNDKYEPVSIDGHSIDSTNLGMVEGYVVGHQFFITGFCPVNPPKEDK